MNFKLVFGFLIVLFSMTSCIDIFDDLTIHNDGTGTYKYTVNLSASKLKINSILALDSLDGKKVPSIQDIKSEINRIKTTFEEKEGISNVVIESDYENFLFKIQCDFENVESLESAILSIIKTENLVKNLEYLAEGWFKFDANTFTRSIPSIYIEKSKELNPTEIQSLTEGKYRSITRFDRGIEKFENQNGKLNPSKTAIALQTNIYSLINNSKLLENTIYLSPLK
jgi:hypothetical protein